MFLSSARFFPGASLAALTLLFLTSACGGASSAGVDSSRVDGEATMPAEVPESDGVERAGEAAEAAEAARAEVRMVPTTAPEGARVGVLAEGIGLAVGSEVAAFEVEDSAGAAVSSGELLGERPVLVVFYRGGWCPFCNHQLHDVMGVEDELEELGVDVVAVSVDRVSEASRSAEAMELPFRVLADPDLRAHAAFDVTMTVPGDEVERLLGMGLDIEAASGRDHHVLAVPSLFLVDGGVVRWAHSDPDYRVRPSMEQVLEALEGVLEE